MTDKIDTRQIILDAAMARFQHYGYAKTTMSEIAKDCGMSAGNIYRFFPSKLDIAEAMARKFNAERFQTFAQIAREDTPAIDRLYKFLRYQLETTYEKLDSDAKVLEIAERLSDERPEFANEELAQERIYLCQILEEGVKSGEFAPIQSPNFAAEMIQTATMKFTYPQLFSALTLPQLRRELDGVMELISAGLKHGCQAVENAA